MIVITDFDGTLTAEEDQVVELSRRAIQTLAGLTGASIDQLTCDYHTTQQRIRQSPQSYSWEVNGLRASYSDEGAFILNTTTLQVMLREASGYHKAISAQFSDSEYDPVVACTNHLFHRHTAEIPPAFRPAARQLLTFLLENDRFTPMILTNSLGDKVSRQLSTLELGAEVSILGDTRQYDMQPGWEQHFDHPGLGSIQVWPVANGYTIDLRRPAYYQALKKCLQSDPFLVVVADTLSLPGALPLMMGIPFFLLHTSYTPEWCLSAVRSHPLGFVLEDLSCLPGALLKIQAGIQV